MEISSSAADIPDSTSPSLALVHPTAAEKLATWRLNSQIWCGRLSLEAYLRRESVLANQTLTRDGGITFWILIDTSAPTSTPRMILASCETYRKRALIAMGNAKVEEVVSHGIGSVYCNPQLRGKGYAGRMMKEIGMKLNTWQQEDGKRADFTVLFSDIGKVRDCENPEHGLAIIVDCRARNSIQKQDGTRSPQVISHCTAYEPVMSEILTTITFQLQKCYIQVIWQSFVPLMKHC